MLPKKLLALASLALVFALALAGCGQAGPSTTGTGGLRVLVEGADSGPLAGAKVISNTQPPGQLKVTGSTGSDGTVLYQNIAAGDYSFYVSVANYQQQDFTITVRPGQIVSITIAMQRTLPPSPSASVSPLPPASATSVSPSPLPPASVPASTTPLAPRS